MLFSNFVNRSGFGFSATDLFAVEVAEDFLGRAQSLLEDVVDAGQALDRFVQHQEREDKAGKHSGGHVGGS